ncbi:hypothetical protein LIER_30849 [Lithospermum erythrorhizon]|uniref:CCHC-type domain-containing protein n=1 Tax=Lithospermum erythrorhizon TaxID=34254 RepID=A0AAV3RSE9_LITER
MNYGVQRHPIQQSRFTQSQFRAPVANSQFSSAGSVQPSTDTTRVAGSEGNYRGRREAGRCFRYGSVSHIIQNCPNRAIIYFQCHQPGHIANHCPQSQGASGSSSTFMPVQSIRGGFQGGRGGRFGGRGNQGRGAGSSQNTVGVGRGRIFTVT